MHAAWIYLRSGARPRLRIFYSHVIPCVIFSSFASSAKGNTKEKQSKAYAFWQAKYREEKMREHMHSIEGGGEESLQYRFNEHSHFDTWGHYKHDFIDSLPPQKSIEQELEGTCSPHAPSYHPWY